MTRLSISRAAGPDWCFHELKIRPRNVCLTLDRSIWSREHPWLGPKQFWVDLGQNFRSACSTFSDFGQYIVADSTVLRRVSDRNNDRRHVASVSLGIRIIAACMPIAGLTAMPIGAL